jgi:nucleotidyltransferase/DNA polymerase involved in DNA repair
MSVLCCRIPDFALTLACRSRPDLRMRPVALLGPDEQVCAASPLARQTGVRLTMTPRQAQMRCPDLLLRPLDLAQCQGEQDAFVSALGQWELPVEVQSWGLAYIDLHSLTKRPEDVQELSAELGRRVRQTLGDDLQPALGWDSSKFTCRAAAHSVTPGRMRLVAKSRESRFLRPLPITLLPLPYASLQQLHWLGIDTLGQFAALPTTAVWQRFGPAGRTAQRWAKGLDDRPIRNTLHALADPLAVEFDPPATQLAPMVETLMATLHPQVDRLADRLEGIRRLHLELQFMNAGMRTLKVVWVEPVSQAKRLRAHLSNQLAALNWPGPLERVVVSQMETAELPAGQLSLFAEPAGELAPPVAIAQRLLARYGRIFLQGELLDSSHPVDARRSRYLVLA